jgi:hypothetical protein
LGKKVDQFFIVSRYLRVPEYETRCAYVLVLMCLC